MGYRMTTAFRVHMLLLLALGAALAVCTFFTAAPQAQAVTTYTQSGYACATYKSANYTLLANANYRTTYGSSKSDYEYANAANYPWQTEPSTLGYSKGDYMSNLVTALYLPLYFSGDVDAGNPQACAITPDGSTLYVICANDAGDSAENNGFVMRYDLAALAELGVELDSTEDMVALRRAGYAKFKGTMTEEQEAIVACITKGPDITIGHGQAFALNPKTGELWNVVNAKIDDDDDYAIIERISTSTLEPDYIVKFKMNKYYLDFPSTLTFDSDGNAYGWMRISGSWAGGKSSVNIIKGTISTSGVSCELVMQGLKYTPGYNVQSIGYNSADGRLYIISDGCIYSVPASKLGKLSKSDVRETVFTGQREFEGLIFTSSGAGYLLTNRGAELMRLQSDLSDARVVAESQDYTGSALTPEPTVTFGDVTLMVGTDYTVSYADNVEVGVATVTITGIGSYSGTATGVFQIRGESSGNLSLYRLYNKWSGEHLFTTSVSEVCTNVPLGWKYEGVAWYSTVEGDRPVYRLYNKWSGDHLYTGDAGEYHNLQAIGWTGEDVSFYSAEDYDEAGGCFIPQDGSMAVYRLFNPYVSVGTHHFTTDEDEYSNLCGIGWKGEGVFFYGLSS